MKVPRDVWTTIISLENLRRAAKVTLRCGRRFKGDGAAFQFNFERNILRLQRDLSRGAYRHGRYQVFTVHEPKTRRILAAPLRDRIVHHAVHDVIEPFFDRGFIFDSYACRSGKGYHHALHRAQRFLQSNRFFLHLDVKRYFPSISHTILKGLLRRSIADINVLGLLDHIIDSSVHSADSVPAERSPSSTQLELFATERNDVRGLPIGNLTSQFFANLYLNELDQFVKHTLKCRAYLRYMDDFVLFSNDGNELKGWQRSVVELCRHKLKLELHEKGGIKRRGEGLGFLGFRIFVRHKLLKGDAVVRFTRRARQRARQISTSSMARKRYREGWRSWAAHARYGDTHGLLLHLRERHRTVQKGED